MRGFGETGISFEAERTSAAAAGPALFGRSLEELRGVVEGLARIEPSVILPF